VKGFRRPPPADDGAGEGEESLVDQVGLNVVRRTAAYSCRLRLFEGGTLTARSVVITTGVTCRRLGVLRREGRAKIIPAGAGSLARPPDQQIQCGRVTHGYSRPVLAPRAGGL
jgi:hypothetical protein